jgi:hypothetical protein
MSDTCRIIASEDSTTISVHGHTNHTINATEYIQLNVDTGDYKMVTSESLPGVLMVTNLVPHILTGIICSTRWSMLDLVIVSKTATDLAPLNTDTIISDR